MEELQYVKLQGYIFPDDVTALLDAYVAARDEAEALRGRLICVGDANVKFAASVLSYQRRLDECESDLFVPSMMIFFHAVSLKKVLCLRINFLNPFFFQFVHRPDDAGVRVA
mgnify:CR=1 FL=1